MVEMKNIYKEFCPICGALCFILDSGKGYIRVVCEEHGEIKRWQNETL